MTDAGVSGEGTQSAEALPQSNPATNSPSRQRLIMMTELPATGLSPQLKGKLPATIYVRVHQWQASRGEAKALKFCPLEMGLICRVKI